MEAQVKHSTPFECIYYQLLEEYGWITFRHWDDFEGPGKKFPVDSGTQVSDQLWIMVRDKAISSLLKHGVSGSFSSNSVMHCQSFHHRIVISEIWKVNWQWGVSKEKICFQILVLLDLANTWKLVLSALGPRNGAPSPVSLQRMQRKLTMIPMF